MTKKKAQKKPATKKKQIRSKKRKQHSQKSLRPVGEYYNIETGEIYPKIFFRQDSLWDKVRRFFGYIP
jgi:hypothetical protein